jgi:phosphoribosylanthranilate isomerase
MSRLFVKICGLTRVQDAELAAALGARALGFVFWPESPRAVTAANARKLVERLPPNVKKVGVFVNEPIERVRDIVDEVGLDFAQLHGDESPEYCQQLGRKVIKAVGTQVNGDATFAAFDSSVLLLVDAHDPAARGGTGRTVDWDAARAVAAERPTILAGGLNAANVRLAIRSVRPYGIDVSSGVESAPGIKDPAKLRSFFEALHD